MATTDFRIGNYVIAEDSTYSQRGQITETRMSAGSRKEMIYKVGINWFFADEMKFDFEAMIKEIVKSKDRILPLRNYDKLLRFRHKKDTHTLVGLVIGDYFAYVITGTGDMINVTFLTDLQQERIYKHLCEVLRITPVGGTKIRFCKREETQRGVLLYDGRVVSLYGEDNHFCTRFDDVLDLQNGINYGKYELTNEDKALGLTTLNDIIKDGKGKEVSCYDCLDYDTNKYPCDIKNCEEAIEKAYQFFKKNGVVVTREAIEHNFYNWRMDYKTGYRDEANGYHLFSPCGCNPFSLRRTTLHPLCEDWQTTYEC